MKTEDLFKINEICRVHKIGFIYAGNLGLIGFLFLDFWLNHKIIDETGEEKAYYYINYIMKKEISYEIFIENRKEKPFNLKDIVILFLKKWKV